MKNNRSYIFFKINVEIYKAFGGSSIKVTIAEVFPFTLLSRCMKESFYVKLKTRFLFFAQ